MEASKSFMDFLRFFIDMGVLEMNRIKREQFIYKKVSRIKQKPFIFIKGV